MKTHRFIILVAVIGILMSGCSSQEDQMTEAEARAEVGEGLRNVWKESGAKTILEEDNSSTVETMMFIGTNTPYTVETNAPILLDNKSKQNSAEPED